MVDSSMISKLASKSNLGFREAMTMLRQQRGLSARQLSAKAGCSPSYVSKMEKGEFVPTVDAFARLTAALGCSDYEVVFLLGTFSR